MRSAILPIIAAVLLLSLAGASMSRPSHFALLAAVLALLTALGCNTPQTTTRRSSLMDYLYPKQQSAPKI